VLPGACWPAFGPWVVWGCAVSVFAPVSVSGGVGLPVGFCGSRRLGARWFSLVASVVRSVLLAGRPVWVGCARGADAVVRSVAPGARVWRAAAFGAGRASFARRSAALVAGLAAAGAGAGLVGFVVSPCPGRVAPAASARACFCGAGSGSWASLALAVGLGLPVVVFWCAPGAPLLPAWWGGRWVVAGRGVWARGWRFVPAALVQ